MATQVGLSAILKFSGDAAVAGMKRAGAAFRGLSAQTAQLKAGMRDIKQGMQGMTIAGAAVGAAAGFTVKKFADFDGQMGAVKAVLGKDAAPSFAKLEGLAASLGATTAFTATQAAEAMENLARAGLKPQEIMAAVPEVLAAAAAEGMDLGSAADIVASNLKSFSLDASEAARVADTLAFVSAKTNTNMTGLQEGLKFVAPVAKQMGFTIEETAASLGVLADIGLKGGLAGTGLKNALLKISKSAKNGAVPVGKFSAKIQDAQGNMLPLNKVMFNIAEKLGQIKNPTERAQASMKLLGLRGMGAAAAFDALGSGKNSAGKIATLFKDMATNAKGSATTMAQMRLDNLKGQFTLLSSAVDGVVNSVGKALAASLGDTNKGPLKSITETLGSAAKAFQFFANNADKVGDDTPIAIQGVSKEMMAFVRGVLRGIQDVKKVFSGMFGVIKRVASVFGLAAGEGSSGMSRLATGAAGVALAMAPIGIAIKTATSLFGPFAKVGVGAMKIVGAGAKTLFGAISKVGGGLLNKAGFAAKLPGIAGKLGKAVSGVEQITAQPVRVVNFPASMGGLGGALGGAGGPAGVGGLTAARAGLASFVSRFGRVGMFLNGTFTQLAGSSMGLAGKLAAGAGAAAGIAAAGYAGWKFGKWLDKKLGISDKVANGLHNLFRASEIAASKQRVKDHADRVAIANAQNMANTLARLSQKGVSSIQTGKGQQRVALTRQAAEQRIGEFLKKQGKSDQQIKDIINHLDGTLRGIKAQGPPKVVVSIDGKKIAEATGKQRVEGKERGVRKVTRRTVAAGATP